MIQLITGNIPYILKEEILRWKKGFIQKHNNIGVSHIQNSYEKYLSNIYDTLTSRSFFSEKKLLILEDMPLQETYVSDIVNALKKKDDDVIVLIALNNPDKRLSEYKNIVKISTKHQDLSFKQKNDPLQYLQKIYGSFFAPGTLIYLCEIKGNNFSKIISEIKKLLTIYTYINKNIIQSTIIPDVDSSIFQVIDAFLYRKVKIFFNELEILFTNEDFYKIHASFIGNLRIHLYIMYCKKHNIPAKDITDILKLGNKSFLVSKTYNQSYQNIYNLYCDLIDFDGSMKRGKLGVSADSELKSLYRYVFLKHFS